MTIIERLRLVADSLRMAGYHALETIVCDAIEAFDKPPPEPGDTLNITINRDGRPVQYITVHGTAPNMSALRTRLHYWDQLEKEVLQLREEARRLR